MAEDIEPDQPLTPAGRLFVQPQMEQVINCAIAGEHPIDVDAIRYEVQNSIMLKHPRFCSLMVRDSCGREHWRKTQIEFSRHFIFRHEPLSHDPSVSDEDAVNDYIADLSVYSPLPTDKPLWEVHLLMAHNTAVFRVHHALGDGISLMSMLLSCCRRVDDPSKTPTIGGVGSASSTAGLRRRWGVGTLLKVVWYTLVYILEFVLRILWLRDKTTSLSGGAGVELWPRRLATARFRIDDMKIVKGAVANATINDVLFGVISSGLSRYLEIQSSKAPQQGLQITGLAMVNLRPQAGLQDITKLMNSNSGSKWGNKFGIILLPVYYHRNSSNPIQFLNRAKAMIDKKKLSLEAPFSYKIGDLVMSFFGAKAITMHMLSYAGVADMQILAAKEIIPDPKVLAKCFENALLEMKEAAQNANKS
ncbi:hypothetical protein RD792_016231 [Penstemon davidsonii]|uniref:Diacylglycerol O-acyltransferase n=1 Tax=Penstemon davidsonii TaxID=160366 RepID=A0ABR0CJP4_9LAMI|nr:hypothetical protein RD792_016231 [Penstemon davidsonii]